VEALESRLLLNSTPLIAPSSQPPPRESPTFHAAPAYPGPGAEPAPHIVYLPSGPDQGRAPSGPDFGPRDHLGWSYTAVLTPSIQVICFHQVVIAPVEPTAPVAEPTVSEGAVPALALIERVVEQTPPAAVEASSDSATLRAAGLAQVPPVADVRGADKLLIPVSARGSADPDADAPLSFIRVPVLETPRLAPPGRSGDDENTGSPEAKSPPAPVLLLRPEGAGLLSSGLPFGLAALERAVRALAQVESMASGSGSTLLRYLVLGSWVLGGALICVVARRRRPIPAIALHGSGTLNQSALCEEDLP
jgi:hypothetical protein